MGNGSCHEKAQQFLASAVSTILLLQHHRLVYLGPQGSGLPALAQARLNAPAIMRAAKVAPYTLVSTTLPLSPMQGSSTGDTLGIADTGAGGMVSCKEWLFSSRGTELDRAGLADGQLRSATHSSLVLAPVITSG